MQTLLDRDIVIYEIDNVRDPSVLISDIGLAEKKQGPARGLKIISSRETGFHYFPCKSPKVFFWCCKVGWHLH